MDDKDIMMQITIDNNHNISSVINGNVVDLTACLMGIVNSVYRQIAKSGGDVAAEFIYDVFHDPDMIESMFAKNSDEFNRIAEETRLKAIFSMFAPEPESDSDDE